jgi:hypothetical protein
MNKMTWIKASRAWERGDFRNAMQLSSVGWFWMIFVPTVLLITVPPTAGAVVAYITPPRGIACRSLSFVCYAFCQFMLSIIALVQNALDDGQPASWTWKVSVTSLKALRSDIKGNLKWLHSGKSASAMSALWWFGSLFAAIGGTTMQITGIYRNCICYAGAASWWHISEKNPAIQIATDTEDKRNSANYWLWIGSAAMIFMAINCYVGWWYQKLIRRRFTNVVKALALPHNNQAEPGAHQDVPRISTLPPVIDIDLNGGGDNDMVGLLARENEDMELESLRTASAGGYYALQTSLDIQRPSPTRASFG